jgi:2-methylcitrate dehydratase PrpD
MSNTAAAGVTTPLAEWVAGLRIDDIPASVRLRAKHLLLDGVACGLVGAQLPWSRVATGAVLGLEGAGQAIVMGTGETTSGPRPAARASSRCSTGPTGGT